MEFNVKILILILTVILIVAVIGLNFYISNKIEKIKIFVSPAVTEGHIDVCIDIPPVLDPIGDLNATEGEPFYYDVNASDPNNDSLYFYDNTTMFEINETTGVINFTPTQEDVGIHYIEIRVTDNVCPEISDSEIVNFTVFSSNEAPIWANNTPIHNAIIEEQNFFLNLSEYVSDPDNDSITFSDNTTPESFPSFSMNDKGIINFTADDEDIVSGDHWTHWVNITAEDNHSASNSTIFNFTVYNVNDPPNLTFIPNQYCCEDSGCYYNVDATDPDPTNDTLHFYDNTTLFVINENTGEIYFVPEHEDSGEHWVRIYVTDEQLADFQDVLFNLIEVNDPPIKSTIGARTVWVNETLYVNVNAIDEEDGSDPGNLTFSDDTDLFDINSTTGVINFTANSSQLGTYLIKVCVNDTGLQNPSENISLCNDGSVKSNCETFSLTITDENRPPNITSYYPENLNLTIYETQSIFFNITAEDPDGTIPSAYWYRNNNLTKYISMCNFCDYDFSTTYGDAGTYNITVVVSDGNLTDSLEWNVIVKSKARPSVPSGGGGGVVGCKEIWTCTEWSQCQYIYSKKAFDYLTSKMQEEILKECLEKKIKKEKCGFQVRECKDVNPCGTEKKKPEEIRACIYTIEPSCFDGIRNCHHGSCEILVDCGGPCKPCPFEIPKPRREIPKPLRCGDKICDIDEIFSCPKDCSLFWLITIMVFSMIVLIIYKLKKKIKEIKEEKKKRELRESEEYLKHLIKLTREAIKKKNIVLAKELYSQLKPYYSALPPKKKKRIYRRIISLHTQIINLTEKLTRTRKH